MRSQLPPISGLTPEGPLLHRDDFISPSTGGIMLKPNLVVTTRYFPAIEERLERDFEVRRCANGVKLSRSALLELSGRRRRDVYHSNGSARRRVLRERVIQRQGNCDQLCRS